MRFDTLLNELVRDAERTRKFTIHGPSAWRPLIHVGDAASAFRRCLELPAPSVAGCFNIVGSNHQKSELARLIVNHVPDAAGTFQESDRDLRDYRVDATRWNTLAGTQSFRTADDGIREVLQVLRSGRSPIFSNLK
jgi:nucleoside-diphosphate-sugar epimerase